MCGGLFNSLSHFRIGAIVSKAHVKVLGMSCMFLNIFERLQSLALPGNVTRDAETEEYRALLHMYGSRYKKSLLRSMANSMLAAKKSGHSFTLYDSSPPRVSTTMPGEIGACPQGTTQVCLHNKCA